MALPVAQVSIIIPYFNRQNWIVDCVQSALRQSLPPAEVLIVDDGSTEPLSALPSMQPLLQTGSVKVIRTENRGVSAARNEGLRNAASEFVLFLDSDDLLEPRALEVLAHALQADRAAIAFGAWRDIHEDGEEARIVRPRSGYDDAYARVVECGCATGGVLIRREPVVRFNEASSVWEAAEFWLDYLALGVRATFVDDIVSNMRQHRSEQRLTIRYDHFEPLQEGRFLIRQKVKLSAAQVLTPEREEALDQRILGCAHSLAWGGRYADVSILLESINWAAIRSRRWYRLYSFAHSCNLAGVFGARVFALVNKHLLAR